MSLPYLVLPSISVSLKEFVIAPRPQRGELKQLQSHVRCSPGGGDTDFLAPFLSSSCRRLKNTRKRNRQRSGDKES